MARDDIMKGRYAQTLWDMTARRPLEAITASEIINCTGTARQTFYDHFSSKQALAGYVLEQRLSSATQDCPQRQTWLKSLELITTRAAERPLFFKGFAGLGAGPSSSQVLARAFSTCILHLLERKGCTPSATTQSAVAFYGFGIAGAFSTWITERELRDPFAASRIMYEGMPSELKRYLGGLVHTQPCKENATDIALASRFFLYQMFHAILGSEPTDELIELLADERTQSVLLLFSTGENGAVEKFAHTLASQPQGAERNSYLEALSAEYTRLFIGPGPLPAYPWESVYRPGNRALFQESTLEVRRCYEAYGYRASMHRRAADDHLGLMLDFLAHLSRRTFEAYEEQRFREAAELLEGQRAFIRDHLLGWVGRYAQDVESLDGALLYPLCASALAEVLEADFGYLPELERRCQALLEA